MMTALAVFDASELFFDCINLIVVGIVTRRNPFRYTPKKSLGKAKHL